MRQFTAEQIQDSFEKLPQELQDAITSPEVHGAIEGVGKKHNLHIDQLGELVDMIGLVMLGLMPSKEFVRNFTRETGLEEKTARMVADDINTEVFTKLRSAMQAMENRASESRATQNISDIEQAGSFDVEQENVETEAEAGDTPEQKSAILEGIENPVPVTQTPAAASEETHTDPLVDHLLANPSGLPEEKITPAPEHKTAEPPKNLPKSDPYREFVE